MNSFGSVPSKAFTSHLMCKWSTKGKFTRFLFISDELEVGKLTIWTSLTHHAVSKSHCIPIQWLWQVVVHVSEVQVAKSHLKDSRCLENSFFSAILSGPWTTPINWMNLCKHGSLWAVCEPCSCMDQGSWTMNQLGSWLILVCKPVHTHPLV